MGSPHELSDRRGDGAAVLYGVEEGSADADGAVEPSADGSADLDGSAEGLSDGTGVEEGVGSGVGSGMKRDGTPAIDNTTISTKMPSTIRIHGRASLSSRGGSDPR